MKVGFTGTQKGMTRKQSIEFQKFLRHYLVEEFHHGDCIGADSEAHLLALDEGIPVVIHPPIETKKRGFCGDANISGAEVSKVEPKSYLDRNRDIVDVCDWLVATPSQSKEVLRSGTWATTRYAQKQDKEVMIIYPK